MSIEITVPRLGWSMEEGTFAGWLKKDGEIVRKGDLLFTLEGDKSAQEIECFDEGILQTLANLRVGDIVKVGQVLGYLVEAGEQPVKPSTAPVREPEPIANSSPGLTSDVSSTLILSATHRPESTNASTKASPRARRRAEEQGVDLSRVAGTGKTGRIRERDVIAQAPSSTQSLPSQPTGAGQFVPHSKLRKTIAQRMLASHLTTAPVTLTTRVNASNLVNLRNQFRTNSGAKGVVPSYSDFIAKLTAITLKDHPQINSRWEDQGLQLLSDVHIAIAVDTPAGLVAPVVQDVTRLTLRELATKSKEVIDLARSGKLRDEQFQGGTFTITNLGAYGIEAFTPVINPPQVAILGIGRIETQPVYVDNQLVPREVLTLSLTFDHRAIDGGPAARFLQSLAEAIENPAERLIG